MATIIARIRERADIPIAYWVLAALVVFGLVVGVIRLVTGLGATTNLSSGYPWGLWIAFDVFTVPLSAGAFTLAAVLHIFNREEYHGVAHLALLAGFLGYLLVVLVLLMDLGRWDHFYSVLMPWRWNLHSFMFEVSISVAIYFGVLVLELVGVVFADKDWVPIRLINRGIPLIAGLGILLSCVHQGSLGALFLVLSHKLHPLWWSPILPILFFASAVFSGLTVAILLGLVTWRAMGKPAPMGLLVRLAKVVAIVQAIYLVLKVGDLVAMGELGLVFSSGWLSVMWVAEMILGVIMPLVIFGTRIRRSKTCLLFGAIYTLLGLALNRSSIAWFALQAPAGATYVPHWMEFAIVIAAFAFGILFFCLGVNYVPTLRKSVTEGEH